MNTWLDMAPQDSVNLSMIVENVEYSALAQIPKLLNAITSESHRRLIFFVPVLLSLTGSLSKLHCKFGRVIVWIA